VVAATDSSKFGRRSLSVIAPLRSLHKIITDKDAAPERSNNARFRRRGGCFLAFTGQKSVM
ncbi:MAG TPA: hypothetical protein VHQ21_17880, partial [Rhodanobacteraceae bacterium]|nr:hypothetical protein [Rhodanobacteraceae bacterium]